MNGYIALYLGEKYEIQADDIWSAKQKADIEILYNQGFSVSDISKKQVESGRFPGGYKQPKFYQ